MDIFLRTKNQLVKMKDKLGVERDGYLITSSLGGTRKISVNKV